MTTPTIGIDFGTTTSSMAWVDPGTGKAEVIKNAEGEEKTPSVVWFGTDTVLVGSPAEQMLEDADERRRVVASIKRELVSAPTLALPGRRVKAVEVAAEVLKKLKRDAEELQFHAPVIRAVVTCPAAFDVMECEAIEQAARLAGFAEVGLLAEPVAAALAYGRAGLGVGRHVLVYDLGGGTFDLALLREEAGSFELAMEPKGLHRCGGDDFDEALYDWCDEEAERQWGQPLNGQGRDLKFLRDCRKRKENLSAHDKALFSSLVGEGRVFKYSLTRDLLEGLIAARVDTTVRLTADLVRQAEGQGFAVDTAVLIGGSSRIPLVQRKLKAALPVEPHKWQHQDVAVALGAAYFAQGLWEPRLRPDVPISVIDTPSNIRESIVRVLEQSAELLRIPGLPGTIADEMAALAGEVYDPAVVAVVGPVKAGKSTFINALMDARDDLATVGIATTTDTINYFRYGHPPDPARPVRCYWRGGGYEDISASCLHPLQGNDLETLRRAEGIDYLEYRLPLDFLRRVTLVDTPGTGAVVDEHHGLTTEYMRLYHQLRKRHDRETQLIGESSDAIIYLIGAVARGTDRALVEEFTQATQGVSRALNAVGVISKSDLSPETLVRGEELAAKVAAQLKQSLHTVLPVSAGLHRALRRLMDDGGGGLQALMDALRRVPQTRLAKLLDNGEFYLEYEFDDCPLSSQERRALLGSLDWTVFTTIARLAADPALELHEVAERLARSAGFEPLKKTLESHFLQRSELLRCFRVVADARKLVAAAAAWVERATLSSAAPVAAAVDRELERILRKLEEFRRSG